MDGFSFHKNLTCFQWLSVLTGSPELDVSLLLQCARVIQDTCLMGVWNLFLEMIYKHFDLLCSNEGSLCFFCSSSSLLLLINTVCFARNRGGSD